MKHREERKKVLVPARVRVDQCWIDAKVLDASSRGLKLQAPAPPPRGAYIEVCRGPIRCVARVVWSSGQRFGVRTQDRIVPEVLVNPPETAELQGSESDSTQQNELRRASRWHETYENRLEQSRYKAKALQYGWVVAFGGIGATLIFELVKSLLFGPIAAATAIL